MGGSYHGQFSGDGGLVTVLYGGRRSVDAPPEVMERMAKESPAKTEKAKEIFTKLKPFLTLLEKRYAENLVKNGGYVYGSVLEDLSEDRVQSFKDNINADGSRVIFGLGKTGGELGLTFKNLPSYKELAVLKKQISEACEKIK